MSKDLNTDLNQRPLLPLLVGKAITRETGDSWVDFSALQRIYSADVDITQGLGKQHLLQPIKNDGPFHKSWNVFTWQADIKCKIRIQINYTTEQKDVAM